MYDTFLRSPEEALELTFKRYEERLPYTGVGCAHFWQAQMGTDGVVYGSYQIIRKADLADRKYRIEFWDGAVSLFWLDVLFDPKTHKRIPLQQ